MKQRRIAAEILKCGVHKIWIDPKNEKVKTAITRKDVRAFIDDGIIKKLPNKKKKTKVVKKQQRTGSIKGKAGARERKKEQWLKRVRPQRRLLKELKGKNELNQFAYRKIYGMIKGGSFRSKNHLLTFMQEKGYIKEKV
jgi:large subunit ribosomal protein L19e